MSVVDFDDMGAIDSTGQLGEALGLAEHLRDALWRVDSAGARPVDAPGGVIVAGMGGSAAGARLAVAALGSRAQRARAVSGRGARLAAEAAADGLRRLRVAGLGGAVDAGLRLVVLGQHRGDAGRL